MSFKLQRQFTGDKKVDDVWQQLQAVVDALNAAALPDGRLIDTDTTPTAVPGKGLAFTIGTARSIPHKLGRKARGFIEVYGADVPSAARVDLRSTGHPTGITSDTHVTVTPAASGSCFLWVF